MPKMIPRTAIPISNEELLTLQKIFLGKSIEGEDAAKLETSLTHYLGAKKAFAVNSGRTALYVCLRSLDLRPGDEVIVPAYTCPIVFEVALRLGLKLVLVDVDAETYNIDPNLLAGVVTNKSRAIVPLHLFGRPCEIDRIIEFAEEHGLFVIEDAAQSLGAEYRGKKVGTFGDLSMFSFGPGKSITGGEGGAVVINDEDLVDNVFRVQSELQSPDCKWILHVLRNILAMYAFSSSRFYWLIMGEVRKKSEEMDYMILQNCSSLLRGEASHLHRTLELMGMPNISAAILRFQLKRIDGLNERRIWSAVTLTELIGEIGLQLPRMETGMKNTFTSYVVKVDAQHREKMFNEILRQGIEAAKPYYYVYDFVSKCLNSEFPVTKMLCRSLMSLPNHPLLSVQEIEFVSSSVRSIAESLTRQIISNESIW